MKTEKETDKSIFYGAAFLMAETTTLDAAPPTLPPFFILKRKVGFQPEMRAPSAQPMARLATTMMLVVSREEEDEDKEEEGRGGEIAFPSLTAT